MPLPVAPETGGGLRSNPGLSHHGTAAGGARGSAPHGRRPSLPSRGGTAPV